MMKRRTGRPYHPHLCTIDEGVEFIKEFLRVKYPNISDQAVESMSLSKKTIYNYRSSGRLQKYGKHGCAMVDKKELEALVS